VLLKLGESMVVVIKTKICLGEGTFFWNLLHTWLVTKRNDKMKMSHPSNSCIRGGM